MDTSFCEGDLWITESALWEELRLKGLVSLALLLLAPLKARGSEVAWRNLERLKLRFLLHTSNTVGHAFLSAQNPPKRATLLAPPVRNNGGASGGSGDASSFTSSCFFP